MQRRQSRQYEPILVTPPKQAEESHVRLICKCGREHAEHIDSKLNGCSGWQGNRIEIEKR